MNDLKAQVESLLFVSSRMLKKERLQKFLKCTAAELTSALTALQQEYSERKSGICLMLDTERVQLITSPEQAEIVKAYLKDERTGELSRPSLETLAIIAYRGPVAKAEIELIRGVNCSLIIRNLLIRGLIIEKQDVKKGVPVYQATFEFMQFLGVRELAELPDFQKLNQDINLQELLNTKHADTKADFFQAQNNVG